VTPQNTGKACCDDQQQAFSCFGGKCAEPTKFVFQRQSITVTLLLKKKTEVVMPFMALPPVFSF